MKRSIRHSLWLAVALVGTRSVSSARAEDAPPTPTSPPAADGEDSAAPPPAAPKIPTPDGVADEFTAARATYVAAWKARGGKVDDEWRTQQEHALGRLASRAEPDGWLVAQVLLARGKSDDAKEFARVRERRLHPQVEWVWIEERESRGSNALNRYVRSDGVARFDVGRWEKTVSAEAAERRGAHREALATLGDSTSDDPVLAARIALVRGRALLAIGRDVESAESFLAAANGAANEGWAYRALAVYGEAFAVIARSGRDKRAADASLRFGRLVLRADDFGSFDQEEWCLKAASWLESAVTSYEALGDDALTAEALEALYEARSHYDRWVEQSSRSWRQLSFVRELERALPLRRRSGDAVGEARVLNSLAKSFSAVGDARRCLSHILPAIELFDRLADRDAVFEGVDLAFSAASAVGDRGAQERLVQRVLALAGIAEHSDDAYETLSRFHEALEEYPLAIDAERRVLQLLRSHADDDSRFRVMASFDRVGDLELRAGRHAAALDTFRAARTIFPESEGAWEGIARAHEGLGQYRDAVVVRETRIGALVMKPSDADSLRGERHTVALALDYDRLGRREDATRLLEALTVAREANGVTENMSAHAALARVHLAHDEFEPALRSARVVLEGARVGEENAAVEGTDSYDRSSDRDAAGSAIEAGVLAALGLGRPSDALSFVECGRANTLTAFLSSRDRIRAEQIPDELATLEREVRAAEVAAAEALRTATELRPPPTLEELRRRKDALDGARESFERVKDAIQRIRSKAVGRADVVELPALQKTLAVGDTLVLYALLPEDAVALVVRPGGARVVRLADAKDVESAFAALDVESGVGSPDAAIAALRELLVEPLELGADTTRVLVSPDGALAYVPFSLLFGDREVCCVPSGTAYALLRRDAEQRGQAVLALGDPDYATHGDAQAVRSWRPRSGGRLTRLPGSGVEAKAVGDVVLVGDRASEASLRDALPKRPRWRAVHFACHGLLDAARPMFSSLALTPSTTDDGFLSVVDVLHMPIAADLVVLSACETGKGTVMKGEGVLGLTRAFMIAGSPRVIVSLWKVDDDATRALMTKFYELWNPKPGLSERSESKGDGKPGLATATALKQAQAHVRSQERWKHPKYWAAWQLWGLPE